MIPQHLIESALALTGKTMEDMEEEFTEDAEVYGWNRWTEFSIEKFSCYILSPEFIEKYKFVERAIPTYSDIDCKIFNIGNAIYEYQNGNEQPLISLLEKI